MPTKYRTSIKGCMYIANILAEDPGEERCKQTVMSGPLYLLHVTIVKNILNRFNLEQ